MRGLYSLLLHLFPKAYREEYGDELKDVFNSSLDDAIKIGWLEAAIVISRELIGLPKAILYEYLRERRNAMMNRRFDSYFDFASGSWKEFLTALLPFFLVGGAMPLLNYFVNYLYSIGRNSYTLGTVVTLALFGLFLVLFAVGVKKGMPRWSLPYLGFLLAILSLYVFSAVFGTPIYFLFRDYRDQSVLFIDILWDGIYWYGLLFAILLLVLLSRVSPAFQHFKNDWTRPDFVLYGGVPFALWITFDGYVGDEPYTLSAFLVLAVGAWLYLRSTSERTRFGSLFIAMTLAMFIAAVGKVLLIPSQTWPITIDGGLARSSFRHTITMWGWFALGMMIPLASRFWSRSGGLSQVSISGS